MINTILFDLDGTLIEPMEGITKAVQYALKKQGIIEEDLWNLTKFIGPPLGDSFKRYYGMSEEQAGDAVKDFREYFAPIGKFQNELYEGVEGMLKVLKEHGFTVAIATSKPEVFAKDILEYHHIAEYFDFVGGALFNGREKKDEVIAYVLEELKADKDKVMMVGDREHDIVGARKNDLPCVGVLYGYGSKEEFEEFDAYHVVETVADLTEYLLSLKEE